MNFRYEVNGQLMARRTDESNPDLRSNYDKMVMAALTWESDEMKECLTSGMPPKKWEMYW